MRGRNGHQNEDDNDIRFYSVKCQPKDYHLRPISLTRQMIGLLVSEMKRFE